jgi:hypothetical protein
LTSLRSALPPSTPSSDSPQTISSKSYQGTLQSLRDLTAFITTRTYSLLSNGTLSTRLRGVGPGMVGAAQDSKEEDIKKEIRALKSLVLNRKTFAAPTRGQSTPASVS